MATVTLNYDGRNKSARAIVEMLRSLDFFKVSEPQPKTQPKDPTLMSKEEYFKMLDERMESYEKGNYRVMLPGETLDQFLDRVAI
ncbi:MAG: hypothetical protein J6I49_00205 [Bacteroidales bacterium]|nr:hypothetical protein [Bacteroidales bacterium]